MNANLHDNPDPQFSDETPRPIEANRETPIERQEQKSEKAADNESTPGGGTQQTITDIQEERKAGSAEDEVRTDGPYGVQEPKTEE